MKDFSSLNINILKNIFYDNPCVIYIKDKNSNLIFSNEKYSFFLKKIKKEIERGNKKNTHFLALSYEYDKKVLKQKKSIKGLKEKFFLNSKKDKLIYFLTNKSLIYNDEKNIIGVISISTESTEIKKKTDQIKYYAFHDALTGFLNRKGLKTAFKEEIRRADRYKSKIGVLYFDIDKFKSINDSYGHANGDFFLINFSKRLKKVFRQTDYICRLGGDEFLVLLTAITEEKEFRKVIENTISKVHKVVSEPIKFENDVYVIPSVSVGYSIFPDDGRDVNALINKSDIEMYKIKKQKSKQL